MNWPDGAALTAFGRQALSLVAQQLRTESVTCLLAPDYYCQTMLVPFLMEGIQVHVVVTGADCLMHGDALLAAVDSHPGCAILHCETFGNRPHADLAATLHDTAGRGIKPADLYAVNDSIQKAGLTIEESMLSRIPQNTIKVEGRVAEQVMKLIDALEDNDDVSNVYDNSDIDPADIPQE